MARNERSYEDVDEAFADGYEKGCRDTREKLRGEIRKFEGECAAIEDLLFNPETMAALAERNPEFNKVLVTAVVMLLLEDAEEGAPSGAI